MYLAAVERIEGWRSLGDNVIETIINKSKKIKALKRAISESAEKKKQTPSQLRISEKDLQIKEYDDTMTARIVESIKVKSRNEIEIQFVGGYKEKKMLN
jgi:Fe2+ transport system protein B